MAGNSIRMFMAVLAILAGGVACQQANGASAAVPAPAADEAKATSPAKETLTLAGGCFWGIQGVFSHVKGVRSATSGYAGGTVKNPSYEQVSTGDTGHAESVQVVYDPLEGDVWRVVAGFLFRGA